MEQHKSSLENRRRRSLWRWLLLLIARIVLPLLILTAGVLYAKHLVETKPKSERRPPQRQARLVEVVEVQRQNIPVTVSALGSVIAAREVDVKPQVVGKVIDISPEVLPGGLFRAGQKILQIESQDYELIVQQRQSDVARAEKDLKLEEGSQSVARQEFDLLSDMITDMDQGLMLRKPQLASAKAALEAAKARLEQARLDLDRTQIIAPFNAVVKTKSVDVGAMVTQASSLVTLTGTDEYWVNVVVPVDMLPWLMIPPRDGDKGSTVRIHNPLVWGGQAYRTGEVIRLFGELETVGRMAQLLVSVKDPLSLSPENASAPRVLIGSFVRAEIQGRTIPSAISIDRELLRDGKNVWLMSKDGKLEIRSVDIVFRGEDRVLVTNGIELGDRIITTNLAAPVEGMPLRLLGDSSEEEARGGRGDSNSPAMRGRKP